MPFDSTWIVDPRIEVLKKGRARIEKSWSQGWDERFREHWWQFWRRQGSDCAATAIGWDDGALLVLLHEIGAPFGDDCDLYEWNDAPGRTKQDVLDLYDNAIASLQ